MGFVGAYGSWNEVSASLTTIYDYEGYAESVRQAVHDPNAIVSFGPGKVIMPEISSEQKGADKGPGDASNGGDPKKELVATGVVTSIMLYLLVRIQLYTNYINQDLAITRKNQF